MAKQIVVTMRDNVVDGTFSLVPPAADIVKELFEHLAPRVTKMIEHRQKLQRPACRPIDCPLGILLELARDEQTRCRCPKHKTAVPKRASRKRVAV